MLGLMQSQPLLISTILRFAARHHGRTDIVCPTISRQMERSTYAAIEQRAQRLANALKALGVRAGDRVASLAWHSLRHLEVCYAVSSMGAVFHTLNPRMPPEQLADIVTQAGDKVLFVDPDLAALLQIVARRQEGALRDVVVIAGDGQMPKIELPPSMRLHCYEDIVNAAESEFEWPQHDENMASALCYTSGTTSQPKGVLYSHRSTVLHAMALNGANALGLQACDRILPAVQMCHVNAVSVPFAAPMAGAALLLPGRRLDGASIAALAESERATIIWAVPTILLDLLRHLDTSAQRLSTVQRFIVGGAACPRALIERMEGEYGITVQHSWGMTESSPIGTFNRPTARHAALDAAAKVDLSLKQGRALFGIDLKVVDDHDQELPWDAASAGTLKIRGPWVIERYYGADATETVGADGWLDTGDVATIDAEGFVSLIDRDKDIIKSGGEWISSVVLENALRAHPDIADLAAIAASDPQWGERPILVIVPKSGRAPDLAMLRAWARGKVPDWWLPDGVVEVVALPMTGTGKIDKRQLRERFSQLLLTPANDAQPSEPLGRTESQTSRAVETDGIVDPCTGPASGGAPV
jgi:acyl-CoA synthetase (AMP-forming)/AMP-acid ligase II